MKNYMIRYIFDKAVIPVYDNNNNVLTYTRFLDKFFNSIEECKLDNLNDLHLQDVNYKKLIYCKNSSCNYWYKI